MPVETTPVFPQRGTEASLQELLLSHLDTSDPTVSLVMQMLANQESANSKTEEKNSEEEKIAERRIQKLSTVIEQLRQKYEQTQTELQELQLQNDTLAAALGACYLCWGNFSACEVCDGQGVPGYFPIDMSAFSEFILPAVRSMKTAEKQQFSLEKPQ